MVGDQALSDNNLLSSAVETEIGQMVGTENKIACQKEAYDFAGNLYYVIEFCETGYLIYHAESGCIIEYSATAPSPYNTAEENLFLLRAYLLLYI